MIAAGCVRARAIRRKIRKSFSDFSGNPLLFLRICAIIPPLYRGIAQLVEYRSPKPWVAGSNPPAPAMLCGQNRSARENKRKREISRDFSRFFVPAFFRENTDPFCDFFRPQGSEPAKTGFSKKSETELNSRKDLNPRHGSNPFGFFVAFTDCLQIGDYRINPSELGEDLNPRCTQKQKLQNNSISPPVGFEPTKVLKLIVISLFSGLSAFGVVLCVVTGGDENEKDDR